MSRAKKGVINHREAIGMALAYGLSSLLLCEHHGGDGLSVCAPTRAYLRRIFSTHRHAKP